MPTDTMDGRVPPTAEILLLHDRLLLRRGLELVLREAGHRIAGLGATPEEASGLLRRRRCDVALVAATLAEVSTATLLAVLLTERPGAPLLVCADPQEPSLPDLAALRPPGLLLTSSPPGLLLEAVDRVARGERFADPALAERLPAPRARRDSVERLSPREREVLGLLAHGRDGAEVAGELYLSAETVRTHVRNAVRKLGARTRAQAVALLVDHEGGLPGDPPVDD